MSSEIAITVRNVCKIYPIYTKPHDPLLRQFYNGLGRLPLLPNSLKERFNLKAENCRREFCALRDVSFEIRRGESVGIIGRNGSGKSTLLQIIAGTLTPTQGEVSVNGRVAALLELGSGFSAEFTGRENVYLNGSLLGMTKRQIEERFDEIAAFADIGEFLDLRVKTYSSGMMVRLAFAVQTVIEPDILIIDEALSVGDFFFQQKCAKRMNQLRDNGTTLLFVSHDMGVVRDLCYKTIYLRNGEVVYSGQTDKALSLYFRSDSSKTNNLETHSAKLARATSKPFLEEFRSKACWINPADPLCGTREARIITVSALDSEGRPSLITTLGKDLTFQVLYQSLTSKPIHVTLELKNRYDQLVFSGGSYTNGLEPLKVNHGNYGLFEIVVTCMIEGGHYTFKLYLGTPGSDANRGYVLDESPWLGPIKIQWEYERQRAPFLGMFGLPTVARFKLIDELEQ